VLQTHPPTRCVAARRRSALSRPGAQHTHDEDHDAHGEGLVAQVSAVAGRHCAGLPRGDGPEGCLRARLQLLHGHMDELSNRWKQMQLPAVAGLNNLNDVAHRLDGEVYFAAFITAVKTFTVLACILLLLRYSPAYASLGASGCANLNNACCVQMDSRSALARSTRGGCHARRSAKQTLRRTRRGRVIKSVFPIVPML
jgi:hypothetical protein